MLCLNIFIIITIKLKGNIVKLLMVQPQLWIHVNAIYRKYLFLHNNVYKKNSDLYSDNYLRCTPRVNPWLGLQ